MISQTEGFLSGLQMEGISLEEGDVKELDWSTPEDGDTAHAHRNDSDKLLEYLREKARQKAEEME